MDGRSVATVERSTATDANCGAIDVSSRTEL
jgi:hypothetical protein